MGSNQKFRWTVEAKRDLFSIVNKSDKPNWSNVAIEFKQKYPQYAGKEDALRKQYKRSQSNNDQETFRWSEEAKKDLLSIVKDCPKYHVKNWDDIKAQFKLLHPLYDGKDDSLRRKYNWIESVQAFSLTKRESLNLVRMVNLISVDGYPNWSKIWKTFQQNHDTFEGTKEDLKCLYEKICNNDFNFMSATNTQTIIEWNEHMDALLAQAIGRAEHIQNAQKRDGRKKNIGNTALMTLNVFKELYKAKMGLDYIGVDAIILKHYYENNELLSKNSHLCEQEIDCVSNIEIKRLQAYASKNLTLAYSKVFSECCHNCGVLFSRKRNSTNRKMLTTAINNFPQVAQMTTNVPYRYMLDDKYITCLECYKTPRWLNDYSVVMSTSNVHSIPNELSNLNESEQNQIALCGGFSTIYKKQNMHRKFFEHRQGECNIGKKRDEDYHNMFQTFLYTIRPNIKSKTSLETFDLSKEKIKRALIWLRKNNRLFRDFLSNYETILGYLMRHYNFHPDEHVMQITKGNLSDMVGKDAMGLLIPADNVKIESRTSPNFHKFGVQHPIQDTLSSIRGIINVNYSDPDLEAKRWPCLFPEGNGSWKRNSSLKPQTYVKHRLLDIDPRFRKKNEFMFFWYDRLIKERLLYYNNHSRVVNVTELMETIQVKDVRENGNRYGSVVPSSVTGSKTYWRARCLDLLALVRDLGKPTLFVTLTQNDNWLELQEACGEISAEELEILKQPFMQPAIGGKGVVQFPIETVSAFFKRLEMFMNSCIHNKQGPFGEIVDFWYRIEYQNRGALHCHMVLWVVEDTLPEHVVMAEMPRYSGTNSYVQHQTFLAREYVKAFQLHTCVLESCKKDIRSRCKYGFPFGIQASDVINESKMGFTYMRRSIEDNNVVPYNLYALLCWNGHINVQKVTSNGIEAYLCKYVSKPERSIDVKELNSEAEKFLKARVVGILECCAHLLQYNQVRASRKTIFLPCDFVPRQRMLKRKSHLPSNNESEDVYYQTVLYKYLVRPKELEIFTYVDLFRFYDVVSAHAAGTFTLYTQDTQDESETEFQYKCDENEHEFSSRVNKVKSQRKSYISHGFKYTERGKAAVPRWRFLMPFGNESEKYYEQRLLLNVAITEEDLNDDGYPFSEENESKTFVEECCLRKLVNSEDTAKSALMGAVQRGFSVERVIEIATLFVDQSYVTKDYVDSIIMPWVESMPANETHEESDNEYGDELSKMIENRAKYDPYDTLYESMTDSQKEVMQWVDRKQSKNDQILAIISGGAGVGKSYITRALYSYFVERKMVCVLIATTGSAAHIIGGTTVHYYLKIDIHGNSFLQRGTISAKIIEDTDVIIVDEFSMLNSDLLNSLNETTKEFGTSKNSQFGGKQIFLIGDPCQLPSINTSVFSNPLLNLFSILLLKETVRQKDESFAALLNRIRVNMMTEQDKVLLSSRYTHVSKIEYDDEALIVTAIRSKMHSYNSEMLKKLPGNSVVIQAKDFESDTNKEVSCAIKEKIRQYVKSLWDDKLVIKQGCIVRLLRNLDVSSGWVNSKRARVFRVANDGSYIVLQDILDPSKTLPLTKMTQSFKLGANLYYRQQYPIVLGYATTVHAVQGMTVTGRYYVDLDRSFWESGQAFVALSRPKELSQLFLLNTHFEKVYLKPYYKDLLQWMTDVDEIAIMRKPRCARDFPLLPQDEQDLSKSKVYPVVPTEKVKAFRNEKNNNKQFKPPRSIIKVSLKSKDTKPSECEDGNKPVPHKNRIQRVSTSIVNNPKICPRLYMLADAFSNSYSRSSQSQTLKLRFGIKFMNELLLQLNNALKIHDVTDPVHFADRGDSVSEKIVNTWNQNKRLTLNLFAQYSCQFRAEIERFRSLTEALDVGKYANQPLANDVNAFYHENQNHIRRYQPVSTHGDGRCFYHSVSMNLLGNSDLSDSLKLILSFHIWNDYEVFDEIFSEIDSSAATVLLKALSYNCWADFEIITAMSYALQRPIVIVSGLNNPIPRGVHDLIYNPLHSDRDPVFIGHVKISKLSLQPNHFVGLLHDESYVQEADALEIVNGSQRNEIITVSISDDGVVKSNLYESDTESL